MKVVGLTGCIGSGKSTVGEIFAELGAEVVDADLIARTVVEPGSESLTRITDRFGTEVLDPWGGLDRAKLASIVFSDSAARADLNAIVHPAVGKEILNRLTELDKKNFQGVAILMIPLLAESGKDRYPINEVIVVDVDDEVAIKRLVTFRSMAESDAIARLAAQASRKERLAIATYVVDNSGTVDELYPQVSRIMADLVKGLV
ncbi:MAG: dephospho-CoA kinase [Acidimicrobiaceae bacterium]|nr:dephospho-CoA kinase [Acidimicrobiaceae bacterium]